MFSLSACHQLYHELLILKKCALGTYRFRSAQTINLQTSYQKRKTNEDIYEVVSILIQWNFGLICWLHFTCHFPHMSPPSGARWAWGLRSDREEWWWQWCYCGGPVGGKQVDMLVMMMCFEIMNACWTPSTFSKLMYCTPYILFCLWMGHLIFVQHREQIWRSLHVHDVFGKLKPKTFDPFWWPSRIHTMLPSWRPSLMKPWPWLRSWRLAIKHPQLLHHLVVFLHLHLLPLLVERPHLRLLLLRPLRRKLPQKLPPKGLLHPHRPDGTICIYFRHWSIYPW